MSRITELENALLLADDEKRYDDRDFLKAELIAAVNYDLDNQVENADTRGNVGQQFIQGAAMNFGDEAMGSIANTWAGFMKMLDPNSVSEITGENTYKDINQRTATQSVRDDLSSFEKRNPGTALAAQLAGGLTTGLAGGTKLLGSNAIKNAPRMAKALSVPAIAGAEGFAMGAGSKEGFEERMTEGAWRGAESAALAPLLAFGGNALARKFMKKPSTDIQQMLTPTEDIETLTSKAGQFYAKADASGIRINKSHYKAFKDSLVKRIDNEGVSGNVRGQLSRSLKEIKALENPSYKDLEKAKNMLTSAKRSSDNAVRSPAEDISHSIDDFIDKLQPGHITGKPGELASDLSSNLKRARNLWHRKAQAETLDDITEISRINAAASDGDMDKAIRSQIASVLKSRNKSRGLDPEVIKGLDTILSGDKGQTALRAIAGVAPGESTRRGLLPMLGAAAGGLAVTGGNPVGLLAGAIPGSLGAIGGKLASKHSSKALDKLRQNVINPDQLNVRDIAEGLMESTAGDFLPGMRPTIGAASAAGTSIFGDNKEDIKTQLEKLMMEYEASKNETSR